MVAAVLLGVGTATPAAAGDCTDSPGCGGEVFNLAESHGGVWITNQWCWSDSGYREMEHLPSSCVYHQGSWSQPRSEVVLPPSDSTERNQDNIGWSSGHTSEGGSAFYDTDGWRAPGGCVTVYGDNSHDDTFDVDIDRRGRGSVWVKVSNTEFRYISKIDCSGGTANYQGSWMTCACSDGGQGGGGGLGGGSGNGHSSGATPASALADLDGDRKADLLAVYDAGGMYWYPGRNDGTYWSARSLGPAGFKLMAKRDLNGDGKADLLAVYEGSNDLYWYPGKGDGSFWSARFVDTANFRLLAL